MKKILVNSFSLYELRVVQILEQVETVKSKKIIHYFTTAKHTDDIVENVTKNCSKDLNENISIYSSEKYKQVFLSRVENSIYWYAGCVYASSILRDAEFIVDEMKMLEENFKIYQFSKKILQHEYK